MLDFSGGDEKAKLVVLHYAKELNNKSIFQLVEESQNVTSKEQALDLARFYWLMLDQSAKDEENNKVVLGEKSLQFWMARLLNIIGGYLEKAGYGREWDSVCDDA